MKLEASKDKVSKEIKSLKRRSRHAQEPISPALRRPIKNAENPVRTGRNFREKLPVGARIRDRNKQKEPEL